MTIRGPFGKFVAWHHYSELLSSNTFLETRIKRLHDGLFTFEMVLEMHVQRMLEMSRCLYTGEYFKQNIREKSIEN